MEKNEGLRVKFVLIQMFPLYLAFDMLGKCVYNTVITNAGV